MSRADRRGRAALPLPALLLAAAALAAPLAGCDLVVRLLASRLSAAKTPASASPKGAEAAGIGTVLPRPLDAEKVALFLYGGGKGPEGAAKWRPKRLWQGKDGPGFDEETVTEVKAGELLPFSQGGAVKAIVLAAVRPKDYDCRACEAMVGAVALTEVSDGWRVDAMEAEAGTWGQAGAPPAATAVQIGPERLGVMLEPGFTNQGNSASSLFLIAGQRDGGFSEIFSLPESDQSNEGSCDEDLEPPVPCWEYASTWSFVPSEGRDLWDLSVTTSGTREAKGGGKAQEFSETKLYRFDGSKYVAVQ